MKFPRRKFLYLAASAASVPALARIARAQIESLRPMGAGTPSQGVTGVHVQPVPYRGNGRAMRDLVAGRSDWLPMIKAINNKEK
jgi:hypothetical protein